MSGSTDSLEGRQVWRDVYSTPSAIPLFDGPIGRFLLHLGAHADRPRSSLRYLPLTAQLLLEGHVRAVRPYDRLVVGGGVHERKAQEFGNLRRRLARVLVGCGTGESSVWAAASRPLLNGIRFGTV